MLWLLVLLAECALLSYIDKKLWKSYFTPLHFLMVPYLLILVFSLIVSGHFGMEKFYYPSLIPWVVGLPLFFASGAVFYVLSGKKIRRKAKQTEKSAGDRIRPDFFCALLTFVFCGIVGGRFLWLLFHPEAGCLPGTACFGARMAGYKVFSHSLVALSALVVMNIYLFRPKSWGWMNLAAVFLACIFLFFYQIQSWLILPVLAGIFARVVSGKTRLSFKLISGIVLGGAAVFFLGFFIFYFSGDEICQRLWGTITFKEEIGHTARLFVHYLTSGTMGLSADMRQGILETRDSLYVFRPFVNILHFITGDEFLTYQNPVYLYTGINYTNVRTFFGTLYVFNSPLLFCLFSLLFGAVSYAGFYMWHICGNLLGICLYGWICTILFMGWFNLYFQLLSTVEIACWIILIGFVAKQKEVYL